jgi:hypothetical protein
MIKNIYRLSLKYRLFLSDFNKTLIFPAHFTKNDSYIKFHENASSGSRVFPRGRMDGRTYEQTNMTELIVAFRNFVDAPNIISDVHR